MSIPSHLDPSSLFSAHGLVAVITGGGTGIGLMMATALENNGAIVYIVGRRKEVLEKAAKENAKYNNIVPVQGDVTSRDSLLSVVSTVESKSGHINLLINNAGIYGPIINNYPSSASSPDSIQELQKALWESDPQHFTETFNVNATAVYYTTVAFLNLLDKGNRCGGIPGVTSQVITTASVAGFRRENRPVGLAYSTSKAAAIHLGKTLANILKDWQIRSNIIAPGIYASEMSAYWMGSTPGELPSDIVPMKRVGTEEEMAGLILYLATRAGAYTSGSVEITDGGRLGLFPSTY